MLPSQSHRSWRVGRVGEVKSWSESHVRYVRRRREGVLERMTEQNKCKIKLSQGYYGNFLYTKKNQGITWPLWVSTKIHHWEWVIYWLDKQHELLHKTIKHFKKEFYVVIVTVFREWTTPLFLFLFFLINTTFFLWAFILYMVLSSVCSWWQCHRGGDASRFLEPSASCLLGDGKHW